MNIKDHIEAGHYPKDEKGRALVPSDKGWIYTILCTDKPGDEPIVAFRENGSCCWFKAAHDGAQAVNLLPPPPRKVKVSRWQLVNKLDGCFAPYTHGTEAEAVRCVLNEDVWRVIELTGEYEKPWPALRIEIVSAERDD